jgi:hypothetical protein
MAVAFTVISTGHQAGSTGCRDRPWPEAEQLTQRHAVQSCYLDIGMATSL